MTIEELRKEYQKEKNAIREWHEENGDGAYSYAAEAEIDALYVDFFGNEE